MKKLFENKRLFSICCAVLCAALLAALLLPAAGRTQRQPETPQLRADEHITLLGGGSAESHGRSGSAEGEANASSGKEGGTEGVEGGNNAEQPPEEQTDSPVSPEQQENNTQADDPSGEQQPDQPEQKPSDPDYSDAEIGKNDDADNPSDETEQNNTGSDGDEETKLDLSAVMTWYKYGRDPSTVVCSADDSVGRKVVYSQLENGRFSYDFELVGADGMNAVINDVTVREGTAQPYESSISDYIEMSAPADGGAQHYTFTVSATVSRYDADGNETEADVTFTFVISYEDGLDLSLYMGWLRSGAETGLTVAAGGSATRTVRSSEIDGELEYSFELRGLSAGSADIVSAVYTSDTGDSGTLDTFGGALELKTAPGSDTGHYTISVTAEVYEGDEGDARVVEFTVQLTYQDSEDLALVLTWYKKSTVAETIRCEKNERAAAKIKQNQLTSGEFMYLMELVGSSAGDAQIVSVSLTGPDGTQTLEEKGSIPFTVPAGESSASYVMQVEALLGSRTVHFTVNISYVSDVSVRMTYTTTVDGAETTREVTCENGRSVSADLIYSDQLEDGELPFEISIAGADSGSVALGSVTLYQSGDGRSMTLARDIGSASYSGSATLKTDGGRAGENQFTITASDTDGGEYSFVVNIPYLPRGEKEVVIKTNLTDGQKIENETDIDLTVEA